MEIDKEKLKIDFSTILIIFILIALIIGGGIYHLINRNKKNEVIDNSVTNNISENEMNEETNYYENNNINEVIL